MQTTNTAILLNIYNASAGSGKTTRLIKEILNLLLKPDDISFDEKKYVRHIEYVRHICGLTFTNAVANELKNRLVQILYDIAFNQNKLSEYKQKYFDNNVKDNTIQERAKTLLSHILHNYSDVSLFTIDAFSNRIMKSFAYELNYSTNYEIAPDTKNYYSQTIDEFLDSIDSTNNEYFRDVLDFLKKDEDKYTHINVFINEIKKMLEALVEKELDEGTIEELQKKVNSIYENKTIWETYKKYSAFIREKINQFNEKVRKDIENTGKQNNYYEVKNNELMKITNSTINGNRLKSLNKIYQDPYNNFLNKNKNGENIWKNGFFSQKKDYPVEKKQQDEENIQVIYNENIELYNKITVYDNPFKFFKMLLNKVSITHLAIELLKQLNELKQKDNVVFFSDFTREINKIIQEETNVDFIYERAGVRYNNFLIDEFQDTSTMQFNNLLPLIHNAMAQGNPNYIVGDPKQSIYIWRNANVGQFVTLCEKKDIPLKKLKEWGNFKKQIKVKQLDINYRSAKNIVEFNNLIFNNLIFDGLKYKNYLLIESVYKNAKQETIYTNEEDEKSKGYVEIIEIEGTNKEEKKSNFNNIVIEKIKECIQKGFQQKDICILLRKNSDIRELIKLAGTKLDNNETLTFISPEGLILSNTNHITFITAFLKQIINPEDKISAAVCWKYREGNYKSENFFTQNDIMNKFGDFATSKKDLYQIVLNIIEFFNLPFDNYTQKFLDIVNKFTYKYSHSNTIQDFLNFWEENEEQFAIESSKDVNAVRIMTIHKSKGLEFPVVITWLNFETDKGNRYWIKLPPDYKLNLPPIEGESESIEINDFANLYFYLKINEIKQVYEEQYNKIAEEEHLENINLIYVAFTRAIHRLYIFANTDNTYYTSIIKPKIELFKKTDNIYSYGDNTSVQIKQDHKESQDIQIEDIKLSYNRNILLANNANLYSDEQVLGIKIHKVLEYINDSQNIDSALCKAIAKGIISDTEKEEISTKITQLIKHPTLNQYFQNNNIQRILNEIEIYHYNQDEENNENIYRPDKIIFTKNNSIAVLEFKTGKELEKYQTQIKRYISILKEIYPDKNIKGFIIYLQENPIEVKEIANEVEIEK